MNRLVQCLLPHSITVESCSSWSSPVVIIRKKDNTWRFCIDYRSLNAFIIKSSHTLQPVDDAGCPSGPQMVLDLGPFLKLLALGSSTGGLWEDRLTYWPGPVPVQNPAHGSNQHISNVPEGHGVYVNQAAMGLHKLLIYSILLDELHPDWSKESWSMEGWNCIQKRVGCLYQM